MQTLLLDSTQENINKAGEILRNGGLVGMPTETVYGLAADALNGKAVAKIFKAKGRPMDNPLIVHIAEFGDIEKFGLVAEIPQKAKILAEKFMPGPLTIIMKKSEIIPDEVSAGLETVAIRCPSHPVARALIKAANTPLAAPSANISGSPSPTTATHVMNDMNGKIEAIIDGGASEVGVYFSFSLSGLTEILLSASRFSTSSSVMSCRMSLSTSFNSFLFSFITVTPLSWMFLGGKREFISISFCMFWVSLLHNSYQATFWFCHLIRCHPVQQ